MEPGGDDRDKCVLFGLCVLALRCTNSFLLTLPPSLFYFPSRTIYIHTVRGSFTCAGMSGILSGRGGMHMANQIYFFETDYVKATYVVITWF